MVLTLSMNVRSANEASGMHDEEHPMHVEPRMSEWCGRVYSYAAGCARVQ